MTTNEKRIKAAYTLVASFDGVRRATSGLGEIIVYGIASSMVVDSRPKWLQRLDRTLAKLEMMQGWR